MKWFSLSLVGFVLAAVRAEDNTPASSLSERSAEDRSSEKRSTPQLPEELPFPNAPAPQETAKNQERARQESTFKDFVAYDAIQSILVNALKPKPIVDTADDSEKLAPNDGSKLQALGGLVVRGSETLSKALNTVIDTPRKAITKLSAGATQALNQLGAYLIGL